MRLKDSPKQWYCIRYFVLDRFVTLTCETRSGGFIIYFFLVYFLLSLTQYSREIWNLFLSFWFLPYFQIKRLVTPKRASVIIISVFIILWTSVAPIYAVNKLGVKFVPLKNRTLIGLLVSNDRASVERVAFAVNNAFIPFSAFVIIIMCTATLIFKLQQKTKWRMKSSASTQADNISSKHQKVAKMVVMISTLFIICFIPFSILFIAMSVVPELSLDGKYRNIIIMIGGFSFVLESINSSVNIFLYFHMSSKYRATFLQLFCSANYRSKISVDPWHCDIAQSDGSPTWSNIHFYLNSV